ncbi:hypothetical protein [Oceanobacillus sp. CF4.6]|uniref:hypothetical protein n=1 Tax=Oceanobacillus sp. CF4.6 TaxID=3373080 RepID=UPI003EE4E577
MMKERRINKPQHVKSLMSEQINVLRNNDDLNPIDKARSIAYLANTSLSAYKDGEAIEKLEKIQKKLEELQ